MSASSEPIPRAAPPPGLRVAGLLSAVVGLVSFAMALAVSIPAAAGTEYGWVLLAFNLLAPLLVCAAAVLIWRRRKVGALLLVLGWGVPTGFALLTGQSPRGPSLLLVLALITVAANWRAFE